MNKPLKVFIVYFLATFATYLFMLDTEFLGDDMYRLLWNKTLGSFTETLSGDLADRPLLMISMWLEYGKLHLTIPVMRTISITFHAFAGLQICKFVREIADEDNENTAKIAFGLGFIWAIHPLLGQSIYVIIQRAVIYSSILTLVSLRHFLRYLKTNRTPDYFLSLMALSAGMLCKPIGAFVPFYFLFLSFSLEKVHWKKRLYLIPYFFVLLFPVVTYVVFKKNHQSTLYPLPWGQYFLVQMQIISDYLRLMVLPLGLKYQYDPPPLMWPSYVLLVAYLGCVLAVRKFLTDKMTWLLFIGFVISFLPESGAFSIHHVGFEHRAYMPYMFLLLCLGRYLSLRLSVRKAHVKIFVLVALVYFCLAQIRNIQLKPYVNWVNHTLRHSTSDHYTNFILNRYLIMSKRLDEAEENLKTYEKLYPGSPEYKILRLLHTYHSNPNTEYEVLQEMATLVAGELGGWHPRDTANRHLVAFYGDPKSTLKEKLYLERILASQMTIFFGTNGHKKEPGYDEVKKLYIKLVYEIMLHEKEFENKKEIIQFLKMRTILQEYYQIRSPGLEKRVQSALKKWPQDMVLQRLKEMLKLT